MLLLLYVFVEDYVHNRNRSHSASRSFDFLRQFDLIGATYEIDDSALAVRANPASPTASAETFHIV